jgi:hypothetical protein
MMKRVTFFSLEKVLDMGLMCFSKMLVKGTNCGLIRGLCPNFIPGGVVSLQYADDRLLFLENNPQVALNLKWILTCFEQISGMRINFHKSELIPINIESEELLPFIEIFQCKEGSFPVKYLGIPLHFDRLKRERIYNPLAEVENQHDKRIKIIRSDRGGEYYGRYTPYGQVPGPFARFLEENGIVAQYSMPGEP